MVSDGKLDPLTVLGFTKTRRNAGFALEKISDRIALKEKDHIMWHTHYEHQTQNHNRRLEINERIG